VTLRPRWVSMSGSSETQLCKQEAKRESVLPSLARIRPNVMEKDQGSASLKRQRLCKEISQFMYGKHKFPIFSCHHPSA
ncbi:hypothetical protein STEG23_009180, partial [Scotinomys teguina]